MKKRYLAGAILTLLLISISFINLAGALNKFDNSKEVIKITKAEHLNYFRTVLSDVYNEVNELDNLWTEPIKDGEYLRITFEERLNNTRDITIYPRIISGMPRIEVYERGENELLAEFISLDSNEYNHIVLTNLVGEQDTFDLKVVGGVVEFDYILDPVVYPNGLATGTAYAWEEKTVRLDSGELISVWIDSASDLWCSNSLDNGTKWANIEIANTVTYITPTIVTNGTRIVILAIDNFAPERDVVSAYSDRGCSGSFTFSKVNGMNYSGNTSYNFTLPAAAVGPDNKISLCSIANADDLFFGYSTDFGNSFIEARLIDDTNNDECDLEVDSTGEVWMVTSDRTAEDIFLFNSSDNFNVFNTTTIELSTVDTYPAIAIGNNDQIYLTWTNTSNNLFKFANSSDGTTWSIKGVQTDNSIVGDTLYSVVKVNNNTGEIYIFYDQDVSNADYAVFLANSSNGGVTWTNTWLHNVSGEFTVDDAYYTVPRGSKFPISNRITNRLDYIYSDDIGTSIEVVFKTIPNNFPALNSSGILITTSTNPIATGYATTRIYDKEQDILSDHYLMQGTNSSSARSWQKIRCLEKRNECILLWNDVQNDINFEIYNVSGNNWVNYTLLASATVDDNTQPFDVECEDSSGECLIVYKPNTIDNFSIAYRLYNDSGLSSEYTFNISDYEGILEWVELYPKINTDEIMLGIEDTNLDVYSILWNGSQNNFSLSTRLNVTYSGSLTDRKFFDFAWEGSSGDGLLVYGTTTDGLFAYNFSNYIWQNRSNIYALGARAYNIEMCGSDPLMGGTNHDYIGIIIEDQDGDLNGMMWNGTGIETGNPTEDASANALTATQYARCMWESQSKNQSVFIWVDTGNLTPSGGSYTIGTGWDFASFENDNMTGMVTFSADVDNIRLYPNPSSDEIFVLGQDSGEDVNFFLWNGTWFDNSTSIYFDPVEVIAPNSAFMSQTFDYVRYFREYRPTYNLVSHNSTLSNEISLFAINVSDETALHPNGQYIFSTNNTGNWVNDSAINFTSTPSWANVTKILNSTAGTIVGYRWYLTDTSGNLTSTLIYTLTTTNVDLLAPSYSDISVNNTVSNSIAKFAINVSDETALHPNGQYIFSTNNTGNWVNDSAINFTSTPSWANVTKILNSTAGTIVGYRWYFNDTAGNANSTDIYSLVVTEYSLSCGELSAAGQNYNLTGNVSSTGNCFNITAQNITLDCNGYSVIGNNNPNSKGIVINSSHLTIKNCVFKNWSTDIYVENVENVTIQNITGGSEYGLIVNGTINSNFTDLSFNNVSIAGIWVLNNSHNNTFTNLRINSSAHGIYVESGENNTFDCYNGLINYSGNGSDYFYGIATSQFNTTIKNCRVLDGNFSSSGTERPGIYLYLSQYSTLSNCSITGNYSPAIMILEAHFSRLINNTGISGNIGINLMDTNNTVWINNLGNSTAEAAWYDAGINIFGVSSNNTLINNTAISKSYALYLQGVDSNILINNTAISTESSALLIGGNDNIITGQIAEGRGSYAVGLASASNNTLRDCINITGSAEDIDFGWDAGSFNNTLINCSYEEEFIPVIENWMIVKWYYQAYVNYSNGNPASDVNITAYNSSGNIEFTAQTNASGWIQRQEVRDYNSTYNGRLYYSNYTLFANKTGTTNDTNILNITLNPNKINDVFTLEELGVQCGDALDIAGHTYTLTSNVSSQGTCFDITADNITLDCNGYWINYSLGGEANTYGVYSFETNNLTIKNCNIVDGNWSSTTQYSRVGININTVTNSTIFNNTIRANNSYGIYLYNNAKYNNLTANTVFSNTSLGIILDDNSAYNTLRNNTASSNGDAAIFIYQYSDNNTLIANNGTSRFAGCFIYLSGYNNFSNNTCENRGGIDYGLYLYDAYNNLFVNNTAISEMGTATQLGVSSNNTFIEHTSIVSGFGYYSISLNIGTNNTNIRDCVNISSPDYHITTNGNSINNTLINCEYTSESIDDTSSQLIRKWYYQAYSNYTNGTAVAGANISAYNTTGQLQFTTLTNSTGYISRQEVTEYVNTGGTRSFYNNYTINANKSGTSNDTNIFNFTLTKNKLNDVFTLEQSGIQCGDALDIAGQTYTLTSNVSSTETCFTVSADNITVDCNNYWINFSTGGSSSTYGIYSGQYNTTIKNCNIVDGDPASSNAYRNAIAFDGANYGNIYNVTVNSSVGSVPSGAIYLSSSDFNLINNSRAFSQDNSAIYFYNSNNNTIYNSTGKSIGGAGIYLLDSLNNSIFYSLANSTTSYGFNIYNANYTYIGNSTGISIDQPGINLASYYAELYNSTGITTGAYSNEVGGIAIGEYNTLSYSKGISIGSGSGMLFYGSMNNTLSYCNATSKDGDGIHFRTGSINNILSNTTVYSENGVGMWMTDSSNNSFTNVTIFAQNAEGIYLISSGRLIFRDSNISSIGSTILYNSASGSTNNTFINSSYYNESVQGASNQLIRKWYYQAYTNYTNGTAVAGANISAYNTTGQLQFTTLTNSTGYISRQEVTEYVNTGGTRSFYNNYTINANKSGTSNDTNIFNFTTTQNKINDVFTLESSGTADCTTIGNSGTLDSANTVYTLTENISSQGTCLTIGADNITLDCNGYWINYSIGGGADTNGIYSYYHNNLTVKNCNIVDGNWTSTNTDRVAINIDETDNSTLFKNYVNTSNGNAVYWQGPTSLNVSSNRFYSNSSIVLRFMYSCSYVYIFNNTIISSLGQDTLTIAGNEHTIVNNNISGANHVLSLNGIDNSNVTNNIINSAGSFGIYLSGENNTISRNTVTATSNTIGLYYSVFNNTLSYNNVTATDEGSSGISLFAGGSSNSHSIIIENVINAVDTGISILNSNSNIIDSNNITATPYGILMTESYNNTVRNTNVTSITLSSSYNNALIANRVFGGNSAYYFIGSNYTNVSDCVYISSNFYDILIGSDSGSIQNVFLNCSFNEEKTAIDSVDGQIIKRWYYQAYTNYTNGTAVAGANISAYNTTGQLQFTTLTNSTGYISRQEVTEYVNTGGTRSFYNNYTINATLTGYITESNTLNLTTTQNKLNDFLTLDEEQVVGENTCGTLDSANTVYTLTSNVSSQGTCFTITQPNITLDCNNYWINYSQGEIVSWPPYSAVSAGDIYNITVKNCNIAIGNKSNNDGYRWGIHYTDIINGTIENNSITIELTQDPIYIAGSSYNTTVIRNTLRSNSSCISASSNYLNIIDNNLISNNTGIGFNGANYSLVENNTIITYHTGAPAAALSVGTSYHSVFRNNVLNSSYGDTIFFDTSSTANHTLINITGTSISGSGLVLSTRNSTMINCTGSSNSSNGINLGGYNNTIIQSTGTSNSSAGITLTGDNNTIIESIGTGNLSGGYGIQFYSSGGNVIRDCINVSGYTSDVFVFWYDTSTNNTLINCSYDTEDIDSTDGEIIRKWYYQAYSNYTNGTAVENANVSAYNTTGQLQFTTLTNSTGYISRQEVTEYVNTGGTRSFYNNYTINANKSGTSNDTNIFNFTTTQNKINDVFTLESSGTADCTTIGNSGTLDSANTVYTLTENISSQGTCLTIGADNITLDCNGYWINYSIEGLSSTMGINTQQKTNITIKNCNIIDGNMSSTEWTRHALYFYEAHNSTIKNNFINTSNGAAILVEYSNSTNITNNTGISNSFIGIYLSHENHDVVINNTAVNNLSQIGLYVLSSTNITLINNEGTSDSGNGIVIEDSNNSNFTNNIGRSNSQYGLYMAGGSSNNMIINLTGTSNSEVAVRLYGIINNTLINLTGISNWSAGLDVVYGSSNNLFINSTGMSNFSNGVAIFSSASNNNFIGLTAKALLSGTGGSAIRIYNSNNTLIRDCINISGADTDINIDADEPSINNSLVNCSYSLNKETVSGINKLVRKWYYQAYTNYTNGTAVAGANISAYNTTGQLQFTTLTNSTGYISRQEVTEYVNTGGTRSFYNNYTINATLTGYETDSNLFNFTSTQNKLDDVFTLTENLIPGENACGTLDSANTVYTLTQNVSSQGTCFDITAENITLDCNGYWINYSINGTANTRGVYTSQFNTTIKNCNIVDGNWTSPGGSRQGIRLSLADFSKVYNNFVNTSDSVAIYVGASTNVNLTNNTGIGNTGYGIYLDSSDNCNLKDNLGISEDDRAIAFYGSDNTTLINNNATSNSNYAFALTSSNNNLFINNTALSQSGRGIYMASSNNNRFINISGRNYGGDYAIFLYSSSNNTFTNSSGISNTGRGVYIRESINNSFVNHISITSGDSIYLNASNNTIFRDCINISGGNYHVYYLTDVGSINNTFINCSYDLTTNASKESINGVGNELIRKWYYQAYSNYTNGTAVAGANISAYNTTGQLQFTTLTNSTGYISRQEVTEYVNTGGTRSYYNNYTINATIGDYGDSNTLNLTTAQNKLDDLFTLDENLIPGENACGVLSSANTYHTLTQNVSSVGTCFDVTGANITIDCNGYWINYSTGGAATTRAVFSNSFNTTVKNCNIFDGNMSSDYTSRQGVLFSNQDNGTIYNNTITVNNSNAILMNIADYNNITNNTLRSYNDVGLELYLSSNNTLQNNNVLQSYWAGINVYYNSYYNIIRDNNLTSIYMGVAIASRNNTLINNTVRSLGTSAGIYIQDSNCTIINNTGTSENYFAFSIEGSNNSIIMNNSFTSNTGNVIINVYNSSYNTFTNNTFISGDQEADLMRINESSWNNLFYWNNFTQTSGYFIENNNPNTQFNTTVGGVAQGNYYYNITSINILDSNSDGWGDMGSKYPLNSTNWPTAWNGLGADFGPYTTNEYLGIQCGDSLNTSNTVYNLTMNVSSSGTCFTISAANVTLDCNNYWINYTGDGSQNASGVETTQFNATVKNCNIYNYTIGVFFNGADNGTIENNTVTIYNNKTLSIYDNSLTPRAPGILIYNLANYNTIRNNTVYSYYGRGIYINNADNNTIINSNGSSYSNPGIQIFDSSNNSIVNSSGLSSVHIGIWLGYYGGNHSIINSMGASGTAEGINSDYAEDNKIINSTGNSSSGVGISFLGISGSSIINSTGISYSNMGIKITYGCHYNRVINSTGISYNGWYTYGISIGENTFSPSNNNIIEDSKGISSLTGDNCGGIYLGGNNNTARRNNVTGQYGYYLSSSNNSNVIDCLYTDGASNDIYVHDSLSLNNTFINCSYDSESVNGAVSQLIRKWYYQAYANYTNGTAVENANISAYNTTGQLQFTTLTNSTGYISRQEVTEYVNTGGTRSYYNNYTINATIGDYGDSNTLNFTVSKNNLGDFFTLEELTSCTCAGIDTNWEIDMSDYCNITISCNLGTGNLTFINTGYALFNATISLANMEYPVTDQTLFIGSRGVVNVG